MTNIGMAPDVQPVKHERYGFVVPLKITKKDKPADVRKLLKAAVNSISALIMRHWLGDTRTYDIDITVTLVPREQKF